MGLASDCCFVSSCVLLRCLTKRKKTVATSNPARIIIIIAGDHKEH